MSVLTRVSVLVLALCVEVTASSSARINLGIGPRLIAPPDFVAASIQPPSRSPRQFPPPGTAAIADATLLKFLASLTAAAQKGDVRVLRELTADTVKLREEQRVKADDFLREHGVRQGVRWAALHETLTLGAAPLSADTFVAPYLAAADGLESDEMVVIGRVALRDAPSPSGRALRSLDYDAVTVIAGHHTDHDSRAINDPRAWAQVRTDSGDVGYVYVGLLWTGVEPRFYFERIGNAWKLAAYGEGE
jgi:hypothetical protein